MLFLNEQFHSGTQTVNLPQSSAYLQRKHSNASLFNSGRSNFNREAWIGDWKRNKQIIMLQYENGCCCVGVYCHFQLFFQSSQSGGVQDFRKGGCLSGILDSVWPKMMFWLMYDGGCAQITLLLFNGGNVLCIYVPFFVVVVVLVPHWLL